MSTARFGWLALGLLAACGNSRLTSTHPKIAVDPTVVDFGVLEHGSKSQRTVVVTNVGSAELRMGEAVIAQASDRFALEPVTALAVSVGETLTLTVTAEASADGVATGRLHLPSNAENSPDVEIPLVVEVRSAPEPDAGAPDAGPPSGDAGALVDAGVAPGPSGGETCTQASKLGAVSAKLQSTLVGKHNDLTSTGEGPDAVYQLTIPVGAKSVWVCVKTAAFTPVLSVSSPCGSNETIIADSADAPCDGATCSRWDGPTPGTYWYVVDSTCTDRCACPNGQLAGDYTLEVTVK